MILFNSSFRSYFSLRNRIAVEILSNNLINSPEGNLNKHKSTVAMLVSGEILESVLFTFPSSDVICLHQLEVLYNLQ